MAIPFRDDGGHDFRPFISEHGHLRLRVQAGFDSDDFTGISSTPVEVARWLRSLADTVELAGPGYRADTPPRVACKCCVDNECECAGRSVGAVARNGEIVVPE